MPAISTYEPTGDPYIDGLLSGRKWAVDSLTFSFPTDPSYYGSGYGSGEPDNNFEAFNTAQQTAVREVLQTYGSVVNVSFGEVTESTTQQGDLRFAESDEVSTAWAYYPSTSDEGGDAWFNNSKEYYDSPVKGGYAWMTVLHEVGHAMGLKHPHDVKGSFDAMPTDKDSHEYTVMSYKSYVGGSGGLTNQSDSYPQTLMMYDIAALQTLYGADYSANSGNTVYQWSATTGEMFIDGAGQGAPLGNKIFMTVWDGGGSDTYDFSNYGTDLAVDLRPGGWTTTSDTQLANLGSGVQAVGNIANALLHEGNTESLIENAVGGTGNDQIIGNSADNVLTGGSGDDTLQGGSGMDTAVYSGLALDYDFWSLDNGATWEITDLRSGNPDGTDVLMGMEFLHFADTVLALGDSEPSEPVNSAPTAEDDAFTVSGTSLSVPAAGVLGNDSDADGDTLSALLEQGPAYGSLTLNADGSFVYTPVESFAGTDSFAYTAFDGEAKSSLATVSLNVEASEPSDNTAPTAEDDAYSSSNRTLSVSAEAGVLDNDSDADGDTLSAVLVQGPVHGSLDFNEDGSFVYKPFAPYDGTDSFIYKAFDGEAESELATVALNLTAWNSGGGKGGGKGGKGAMAEIQDGSVEDWEWAQFHRPHDTLMEDRGMYLDGRASLESRDWLTDAAPEYGSSPELGLLGYDSQYIDLFGH